MRAPLIRLILAGLVLTLLPAPAPAAAGQQPGQVLAVGGEQVMHRAALERAADQTGSTPVRLGGSDRYATAVAVSRHAFPEQARTVVLASGVDFPDALAATPLLGVGVALLLTAPAALPEATADELVRLDPEEVILLGGPHAISEHVAAQVQELGVSVERVAGSDRYATSAAAATRTHLDAPVVYIASGDTWPDALAAVTAIAAVGAPVLLTASHHVPMVTGEALVALAPDEVVILGGPAAVSDAVLTHIGAITGTQPIRIAGATRRETAELISASVHPDGPPAVVFATTGDFPDALAAAPAVVASGGALLLLDTTVSFVPGDLSAVAAIDAQRAGNTSFAVIGTDGQEVGHQPARAVAAASTLKVMFLTAYLRQPSVADRDLTGNDLELLEPMIVASGNSPASAIANQLGPGPLYELAAAAGMSDFAYTRPWGNSRTSARDQVRLMHALPELLPPRHQAYALDLLTRIVPEQRWGVGTLELPDWAVHFKGGWGSGTGSVDHQVVLLRHISGARVAVAVMNTASPSQAYGNETLRLVFQELLADLP